MTAIARAGFEYFDVEADVGVRAWGRTPDEAFAEATLGVLALAVVPAEVRAVESREVRAQGDSLEGLLVNWINECLYVHEIEGFAVAHVSVEIAGERLAHGRLHGEPIDRERHRLGTNVKAATRHRLRVRVTPGRTEVELIVDV